MDNKPSMHYVCTLDEAWQLVKERREFWVSNCGCREQRGDCARSRIDLCLDFYPKSSSGGSGTRKTTIHDVEKIFQEAREKHLVTRPFRDLEATRETIGICFCCDDCCGYFLDPQERCDKGIFIEKTDREHCNNCGVCVDVCYFKARDMVRGELVLDRDKCYGCGLCHTICPESCVVLDKR